MRATVEQIKAAILYPDEEVRESAVCYFRHSPLVDQSIMPLVIQAYKKYGRDAFTIPNVWPALPQSPETLDWVIGQLQGLGPIASEAVERYFDALVETLYRTDAAILVPRLSLIQALSILSGDSHTIIENRIHRTADSFETLWTELLKFCESHEEAEEITEVDSEFANAVIEHLSRFPNEATPRVLAILEDEAGSRSGLLEQAAIELAGRWRFEEAIPLLVDRLAEPDIDIMCSEAVHRALENIGTDAIIIEIEKRFPAGDWDYRAAMAAVLEDLHSDLSVRTSLELFQQEEDDEIKGFLLQAALMNFATEAIEPGRQFVISQPKTPEQLEVRTALLTACKLLGESFPEYDEWLEDSKHDIEFRRQWYIDHPPNWATLEDAEFDDDEFEEHELFEDYGNEDEIDDVPDVLTFRRAGPKVGRNEQCPCGSGKKYKKCCGLPDEHALETDGEHAAILGSFQQKGPSRYPLGTFANYGPDDETTTKIVVGIITHEGADPILERWVGTKITQNPRVKRQVEAFLEQHKVTSVVVSQGNMGCPHEEGLDFPIGEDCPFCPFWAGKQGSNRRE